MQNLIIIGIIIVLVIVGVIYTINHFKGKSGCCGSGNTYVSKKKLKKVIMTKAYSVNGMTCKNCKARVERYVNDIDGAVGKVNLKKKQVTVFMEREISDKEIVDAIIKAGYEVV